ncbi:MAG: ubiquitin-conjugating enzyme E2 [Edaphobacter sp.]|uniref:ubiquitin-conjugating enzyme E2 variant n=1 Tax=Edaphobacter sp. TaxID=1934404 RepID=UPI00238544C1|nr:ubiquitin-conjugating enzyme E2 [Edaphobacter sp.]MDE1178248.1 ubiquitin-conjugating enzyme E2 [Edaphobacter sp.]
MTFAAIARSEDEFRIDMQQSPAWVGGRQERKIETAHMLRYVYPRYYPLLPLEGYFARPIFHVNVDLATGFVCLWQDYRPAQTIVDAILITRAIMAGKVANLNAVHRMQQDAVLGIEESPTLSMMPLLLPLECRPPLPQPRSSRRRLASELDLPDTARELACDF